MKAKLKTSVHLQMGNYVNQVHHTTNTGEGSEVEIKINFEWFTFAYAGNM